jgi:AraC-like DNA-binding protein
MAGVASLRTNTVVTSGIGASHVINVSALQSGVKFSEKVKTLIKSRLYEGCPDIDSIARMLFVSVRTLQRKLSVTGLTYSEMVQQARYEEASKMLIDGDTKIIDIAYDLGYEDPSNFSRAFRRIAGASPCEFRARAKLM